MTIFRCLALALCLGFLPGCASTPSAARPDAASNSVLLVSIDGFRADYLDLGMTPNLSRIAREGVRAEAMTPSYPALTFPNHYTLVTGLVPDHQGMIHNTMRDPALGTFKLSDRMAVGDSRWWGGEPIWVGAEKAGLRTATMYWPGSEAAIQGVRPTRYYAYTDDTAMPLDERVDLVVGWLSEPERTRPRFATLYFETVDKYAHAHGPDSPEAHGALRTVDAAIGRLLAGLEAHGALQRTDLIVVSDHGMATVPPGQAIAAEDMVGAELADVITIGQVVAIQPKPGREAEAERVLLGRHEHYQCWRKSELPPRWRTGTHPRTPDITCQMDEGWDAVRRETLSRRPDHDRGSHGYDPALPSMQALFVARGPSFRSGVVLPRFDNVDLYPLLARLVGIEPAPNDGNPETLMPALEGEFRSGH